MPSIDTDVNGQRTESGAPSRVGVVFGGSGYIGSYLIKSFLEKRSFDVLYNFDIRERDFGEAGVVFRKVDVRQPIREQLTGFDPGKSWIFNLAALCREPGSEPREYFDTNAGGAETVTAWAEAMGFRNIYFTSTMSSYGRMESATPETTRQYPETPYGISKALAERTHEIWFHKADDRRLVICRPGVIFGPGSRENIYRMMKAVRKGYFFFSGDPDIVKGYGYIYGLVESVHFVLAGGFGRLVRYNYAEKDCLTLRGMVQVMQAFYGKKTPPMKAPLGLLVALSYVLLLLGKWTGRSFAIHPVRVRKVAFPTNLKPAFLIESGFQFKYPLDVALKHWRATAPGEL